MTKTFETKKLVEMWSNPFFGYESVTERAVKSCCQMLDVYMPDASDYEAEKFIKMYFEPLYWDFKYRLKEQGLDPVDVRKVNREGLAGRMETVERGMINTITRQARFYQTVLPAVGRKAPTSPLLKADGPALARQRHTLYQLCDTAFVNPRTMDRLEGLINFLDAIADYMTDHLGINACYTEEQAVAWQVDDEIEDD